MSFDAPIWSTQAGTPLDPSAVRKVFDRLLDESGISTHCQACRNVLDTAWAECGQCGAENRMVTPHDLRHSCASTLIARQVNPVTVLARMGWSKISMLDRYAHASTKEGRTLRRLDPKLVAARCDAHAGADGGL